MIRRRYLPWEYGVRNLMRRPTRTLLTIAALQTVVLLVFVVVGFVRGLERSLTVSGDRDVVLVYSLGAQENIENSSIAARTPELLSANIRGIQEQFGVPHVSPELYLGTRVQIVGQSSTGLGLVRGVTSVAPMVRRSVRLEQGTWPGLNQVIVGNLVAAKLGCQPEELAIGKSIIFDGKSWSISGHFSANGSAFESEIWCRLEDFQQALKRQDLSQVAILMQPGVGGTDIELLCKQRRDLELQSVSESNYYQLLRQHYKPVRLLAWVIVFLIGGAGVFAGLNMMYGSVAGRIRELATLQAIGYRRRAILVHLLQEGMLMSAAGSLVASVFALGLMNGVAVRFTMGAFTLKIDAMSLLIGSGIGLALGVLGAIPPALKALRLPVSESIKAI